MSTLTYPNVIAPDTTADATQVESNFLAVATVVNGNIDATNVSIDVPVAQTSAAISAGSSSSLSRADHKHTIQCVEQLSSDPGSGNFDGRMYFNTSTHKVRQYLSSSWKTVTNLSATDLVAHAAQHGPAGDDVVSFPACQVHKASDLGVADTTQSVVAWTAADVVDTDTMHSTSVNNTRITFTHAGLYRTYANVPWDASATGDRWAWIRANGSSGTVIAGSHTRGVASGQNPFNSPSASYLAAAADYIELVLFQSSGGTLNALGSGSSLAVGSADAVFVFGAEWIGSGA